MFDQICTGGSGRLWAAAGVLAAICLASGGSGAVWAADWLRPVAVAASADGKTCFVAEAGAKRLAVVDLSARRVAGYVPLPAEPTAIVPGRDGARLFVTCAAARSVVCVVDTAGRRVTAEIPAGHTATGAALLPDGKRLYVCNRFDNDVSVIDLAAGKELGRVPAVREPCGAAATPDGKSVFVINQLPLDRADGDDVAAVVTVIDAAGGRTSAIRLPNGSTGVRGLCLSPDGKRLFVVHLLSRYQLPTTQLERGWMNTNALSVIDTAGKSLVNTVLLDDVDLGAANPWGVALSADGRRLCVTHAGTDELSVIDAPALLAKLERLAGEKAAAAVPNDLAFLVDLRRRVKLPGRGPRGMALAGSTACVAEYFSDGLALVDVAGPVAAAGAAPAEIALGPPPRLSVRQRGELLFHDGRMCFQHWQSCASCHPDARSDGLNWDLMNDGLGNPKNTKSMLFSHRVRPSMWLGVRPDAEAAVRAGITHILFAVRPEEDARAIDEYLKALSPLPSPHLAGGRLSPAAERGKQLFGDARVGCARCHPEPLYTDQRAHDVGSRGKYDAPGDKFITPTLIETWRTAPYLHDGRYTTLTELLDAGRHGRQSETAAKLMPAQIRDLVEFVLSL